MPLNRLPRSGYLMVLAAVWLWAPMVVGAASSQPPDAATNKTDTSSMLIRDLAVRAELELSEEQAKPIDTALKYVNHILLANRDNRKKTAEVALRHALARLNDEIKKTLKDTQYKRFSQIIMQVQGDAALLRNEVANALALTDAQRRQLPHLIRKATHDLTVASRVVTKQGTGIRSPLDILTNTQKRQWRKMLGKPFDLSKVEPIGVYAPEFEKATAWINSKPLTMASLRGQVAIVHFYTFACGNCIHNLPHYRQWQKDLGGKGVTIVGIHTPESAMERNVDAVRRRAEKTGLTFPILVDNDRDNWTAWSNRVWPSVYLIDKAGQLRYWWYGELNWKGEQGEKRMRAHIDRLLKEKTIPSTDTSATQP